MYLNKRKVIFLISILSLVFFLTINDIKSQELKVIDGDTTDVDIDLGFGCWLHKQRIRFYGIDTPESRTRDLTEKKFGLMAKEYVQSHMPLGSAQTLITCKDGKGKYGRILGEVICYFAAEDRWAGSSEIMISEGHGVAYHGQSKDDIAEEHLANRIKLQEAGLVNKE